jgi:hypothetical protein
VIATLKQAHYFDVAIGEQKIGVFRRVSAWEGLAKLENDKGQVLLVVEPSGVHAMLDEAFGTGSEVRVVMALPSLNLPPQGVLTPVAPT